MDEKYAHIETLEPHCQPATALSVTEHVGASEEERGEQQRLSSKKKHTAGVENRGERLIPEFDFRGPLPLPKTTQYDILSLQNHRYFQRPALLHVLFFCAGDGQTKSKL